MITPPPMDINEIPEIKPGITLSGVNDITKEDLKQIRSTDFKFGDRRDFKAKLSQEEADERAARPKVPRMAKSRITIDRVDASVISALEHNTVEYIKQELIRALACEISINRELYSDEVIDSNQLSNSNKRMIELSDSLKSLPKQHEGGKHKDQKSAAEVIEDTLKDGAVTSDEASKALEAEMLAKAADSFEED